MAHRTHTGVAQGNGLSKGYFRSGDWKQGGSAKALSSLRDNSDLEPERASISLENGTLDFLLLGTGMYAGRELADVIVLGPIILVQHLNLELGIARDILDLPEFIPYRL